MRSGVKPAAIAGSSIGALVGAAYAAGMSGKDLRRYVIGLAHDPSETMRGLSPRAQESSPICLLRRLRPRDADRCGEVLRAFLPDAIPADFSELDIPLTVMATDLHRRGKRRFLGSASARACRLHGHTRPASAGQHQWPHSHRWRHYQSVAFRPAHRARRCHRRRRCVRLPEADRSDCRAHGRCIYATL